MSEYIKSIFYTPGDTEMGSLMYITWVGHRKCDSMHVIGPRVLEDYKLVLVLSGRGSFEQAGNKYDIRAGNAFYLFPGVKHYYYADKKDPWEIMWLCFNGKICGELMSSIQLTPENPIIYNVPIEMISKYIHRIIADMENEHDMFHFRSNAWMYLIFSELVTLHGHSEAGIIYTHHDFVQRAVSFIKYNYHVNIGIDDIAQHLHISRSYLSRTFQKEIGVGMHDFLIQTRMKRACTLLKNTDLDIYEIARSVGIENAPYFSKLFKRFMGMSPTVYRQINSDTKLI